MMVVIVSPAKWVAHWHCNAVSPYLYVAIYDRRNSLGR